MSEPTKDEGRERLRQQKIRRQLDEALADSFPASDPVCIVTSQEEEWMTSRRPLRSRRSRPRPRSSAPREGL